jgi:hypothetical protein
MSSIKGSVMDERPQTLGCFMNGNVVTMKLQRQIPFAADATFN